MVLEGGDLYGATTRFVA